MKETKHYEITLEETRSNLSDYANVIWTHAMFCPTDKGIKLISSSLKCEENRVKIARAQDVDTIIVNQEVPQTIRELLPNDKRKLLLVCMVGGTSLRVAQSLARSGIDAESLAGGIMGLPDVGGRHPSEILQFATE